MVIQRSWKPQIESNTNGSVLQTSATSSSDDSNGSSQTNNSVTTSNTNNSATKLDSIKYATTPQMAESVLGRLKQRFGTNVSGRKSSTDAAMRSLELLRITIQIAFDKEVDVIVRKFIETYFKPAIENIKENLGDNMVTDEMLQKMMCALLENSKAQYNLFRNKSAAQPTPFQAQLTLAAATAQSDQTTTKPETSTQTNFAMKRPAPKANTPDPPVHVFKKPTITASVRAQQQQQQIPVRPALIPTRRHIFWNTAVISTETNFVLDVQANQAFDFGTDGHERLATKHPELIRYLPDGQDRDWLVEKRIIPSQNRNSRFLFLIYDEVKKLGLSDLYKNRENLNLSILYVFKVPNFMIQKMKLFFIDLTIKSRGMITHSYSGMTNSSHLRNALLQGNTTQTVAVPTVSTSVTNAPMNNVSTSTDTVTNLPKVKSSLSSSHATLTALLNNNSGTNGGAKLTGSADKRPHDTGQLSTSEASNSKPEHPKHDP